MVFLEDKKDLTHRVLKISEDSGAKNCAALQEPNGKFIDFLHFFMVESGYKQNLIVINNDWNCLNECFSVGRLDLGMCALIFLIHAQHFLGINKSV